jgi:hypothetical protein
MGKISWTPAKIGLWIAISLLGAVAWFMLALVGAKPSTPSGSCSPRCAPT